MRPILVAVAVAIVVAACGSADDGACGPMLREPLDPASGRHVLPSADEIDYASDPPTSGPHQPSPPLEPVQDDPLPRPVQVGVLEAGGFLLQYDPEAVDDLTAVGATAGGGLVVAPNPDLDDPVVLTAWTAKQACSQVDVAEVEAFVRSTADLAPGADG